MSKSSKEIDLKNIKKAKTGGYQIQFIVNGKSHSGFSMDISEAIKIRDKLRKKLKIIPNSAFKKTSLNTKKSLIPGTKRVMPVGITFITSNSKNSKMHSILVNWKDFNGKSRVKNFYCSVESTYTVKKAKEAYAKALKFRKAYEKAVLDEKLKEFTEQNDKKASFKNTPDKLLRKNRSRSFHRKR